MKKKVFGIPQARNLIRHFQFGTISLIEFVTEIVECWERGYLALDEAEWILKNIKTLEKARMEA